MGFHGSSMIQLVSAWDVGVVGVPPATEGTQGDVAILSHFRPHRHMTDAPNS